MSTRRTNGDAAGRRTVSPTRTTALTDPPGNPSSPTSPPCHPPDQAAAQVPACRNHRADRRRPERGARGGRPRGQHDEWPRSAPFADRGHQSLVGATGIEPVTSSVSGKRSPAELSARGGGGNRTRVQGFAGPCLCHSATPPGSPSDLGRPTGHPRASPSGRRDSNPRPSPWQGDALPTEPRPQRVEDCIRSRITASNRYGWPGRMGRMRPWQSDFVGRYEHVTIEAAALKDNPLGDDWRRPLWVYLPPAYDAEPDRRFPVIYLIQGYTGTLGMWGNRSPFRPTVLELVDDLFGRSDAPPALVVGVDAWTAYGGSQYVDSPGTGRYHTYLCEDVVRFVDAHWRTIADRESRAITGKSSGGFGAMITPMLRPDLFGALATHAGDALYEYSYLPEFAKCVRHLRAYDGDLLHWWDGFRARTSFTRPEDRDLLMLLGVSACFSARDDGTPEPPFDPVTGVLRPDLWQRWLDRDPVRMVPRYAGAV